MKGKKKLQFYLWSEDRNDYKIFYKIPFMSKTDLCNI